MPKPSLDLGGFAGLNEGEARVKFEQQGPNEIPAQRKRGLLAIVLEVAREPMFIMLVVAGSVYLTLGETSDALSPNIALWCVLGGTVTLLPLVLLLPFAQRIFHFAPIHARDLALCIVAGLACVLWFDLLKLGKRWLQPHLVRGAAPR